MNCPRCQKEINDESAYCNYCGCKIIKCPSCQNTVSEHDQYCNRCGNHLSTTNNYYQPIRNTHKTDIKEQIDGYYQPLEEFSYEEVKEETISFEDIPKQKKVDFKIVIIGTIVLALLTISGYYYLNNGENTNFNESNQGTEKPIQNDMTIKTPTSYSTYTGNMNMSGTAFFDEKMLYICDDQGYIVRMDPKLENRVSLLNQKSQYLNVVNDTIYYTNENNNLCSMSTDGKNQKLILNKSIYYLIVKDDKAYYQLDEGEGVGEYICVYDLKTNKQTKLNNRSSYNLNILEDKIYYSSEDGIYSMGIDGKGEEKLVSGSIANVIVQDNKIYYGQDKKGIISYYDISTKKIEDVITKDAAYFLNITSQYIFYLNEQSHLMRYDFKTKEKKSVYNNSAVVGLQIVGDKLIVEVNAQTYKKTSQYKVIMDFDGTVQQRMFAENDGSFI